jgi:hypothetical protein
MVTPSGRSGVGTAALAVAAASTFASTVASGVGSGTFWQPRRTAVPTNKSANNRSFIIISVNQRLMIKDWGTRLLQSLIFNLSLLHP